MKIIEAINITDTKIPNLCSQSDKLRWLSTVDWTVKREIIDGHEGCEEVTFTGYGEDTDLDTELLVPAPYDVLYLHALEAQIHDANAEHDRYNNATGKYNAALLEYRNYYNRQHMPLGSKLKFF